MNPRTDVQTIFRDGKPAFVVIPYDVFQSRFARDPWIPAADTVPHEVVKIHLLEKTSMARAWREHLGLSQAEVAERMGITQSALSQIERAGARPRRKTLEKLRQALGLRSLEQLR